MFQFPRCPRQGRPPAVARHHPGGVTPFGHPRISACSPAPRGVSPACRVLHRPPSPRHPPRAFLCLARAPCPAARQRAGTAGTPPGAHGTAQPLSARHAASTPQDVRTAIPRAERHRTRPTRPFGARTASTDAPAARLYPRVACDLQLVSCPVTAAPSPNTPLGCQRPGCCHQHPARHRPSIAANGTGRSRTASSGVVEPRGFEPRTSAVQRRRSPS